LSHSDILKILLYLQNYDNFPRSLEYLHISERKPAIFSMVRSDIPEDLLAWFQGHCLGLTEIRIMNRAGFHWYSRLGEDFTRPKKWFEMLCNEYEMGPIWRG